MQIVFDLRVAQQGSTQLSNVSQRRLSYSSSGCAFVSHKKTEKTNPRDSSHEDDVTISHIFCQGLFTPYIEDGHLPPLKRKSLAQAFGTFLKARDSYKWHVRLTRARWSQAIRQTYLGSASGEVVRKHEKSVNCAQICCWCPQLGCNISSHCRSFLLGNLSYEKSSGVPNVAVICKHKKWAKALSGDFTDIHVFQTTPLKTTSWELKIKLKIIFQTNLRDFGFQPFIFQGVSVLVGDSWTSTPLTENPDHTVPRYDSVLPHLSHCQPKMVENTGNLHRSYLII